MIGFVELVLVLGEDFDVGMIEWELFGEVGVDVCVCGVNGLLSGKCEEDDDDGVVKVEN